MNIGEVESILAPLITLAVKVIVIVAAVQSCSQEVHFAVEIDQLRLQVRQMGGVFHVRSQIQTENRHRDQRH